MISGFTYVHNALHAGYPIREAIRAVRPYVDEMVVVDADSDDGTLELLGEMPEVDNVIQTEWGADAGETLKRLHAMHTLCKGDIIVHFEADEVFDSKLLDAIAEGVSTYSVDWLIPRLQVEQNFQRVRWYPEYVHRVFPKGLRTTKEGHTTFRHRRKEYIPYLEKSGFLWDVTNCSRDRDWETI